MKHRLTTLPSQEVLSELLNYDPESGVVTWKIKPSVPVKIGAVAGHIRGKYRQIAIHGKKYTATAIIWKLVYGEDIEAGMCIDHINHNPDDNRLVNLRKVTTSENVFNQRWPKRELKRGVSKKHRKWRATLGDDELGVFDTYEEAVATRVAAELAAGILVAE